jgi:hypothetical protein
VDRFTKLGAGVWAFLKRHDKGDAWRQTAEANGLTRIQVKSFLWITTSVVGWKGSLHVRFESISGSDRQQHLQVTISGVASDLAVHTEGLRARIQKRLGLEDDIQTGDDLFDAEFLVRGMPRTAHALLDGETRGGLRRLFAAHYQNALAGGTLLVLFAHDYERAHLDDDLKAILDLAQRLSAPRDTGARIARNALEDGVDGVRRRCLLALLEGYGQHPALPDTLRRARADGNEEIRLEAALASGDDGHAVLRALASGAESEACAARAIAGLGARLGAADARSLLEQSLDRRRDAVAIACLDGLGPSSGSPEVQDLTVRALGHSGPDVRRAAAEALGRLGTVTAVLPLQEASRKASGPARRAMEDAVRAIQARLIGAARGQLTVSSAEGGIVSLAVEGGQVSLPHPDGSPTE